MTAKQKIPTPLDYVAFLAGLPAPMKEEEPEVYHIPVPSPMYLPHPQTFHPDAIPHMGPTLPPPLAPEAPPMMDPSPYGGYGGY